MDLELCKGISNDIVRFTACLLVCDGHSLDDYYSLSESCIASAWDHFISGSSEEIRLMECSELN